MQLLLEHDITPGTSYNEDYLLYGECGGILNEMDLHETTDDLGSKVVKFRGKFQEAEAINKNKRMYPFEVLSSNVKRLEESIKHGSLIGELDHPDNSILHFRDASHKITKLWWENKTLMGEGVILGTPLGKVLRALINDGVRIGISSRGVGNGKVNEDGILVIGESYRLVTFDAVADPSTHSAFQERVVNTKRESVDIPQNNHMKNEDSSIHISNELLLACFECVIKEKTNQILKRG